MSNYGAKSFLLSRLSQLRRPIAPGAGAIPIAEFRRALAGDPRSAPNADSQSYLDCVSSLDLGGPLTGAAPFSRGRKAH